MNKIQEIKAILVEALKKSAEESSPKAVWELAIKALKIAQEVSPELHSTLDRALETQTDHYPNLNLAYSKVCEYEAQQKRAEAAILRERLRLQCDAWAEVIIAINDTDAPDHIKAPMLAIAEGKLTEVQTEMRNLKNQQP